MAGVVSMPADVAWIVDATSAGTTITAGMSPMFQAFSASAQLTLQLPAVSRCAQHDRSPLARPRYGWPGQLRPYHRRETSQPWRIDNV